MKEEMTVRHDYGFRAGTLGLARLGFYCMSVCNAMFNIQQFYILPTQCIYVFGVDLRTNSDYFPIQH